MDQIIELLLALVLFATPLAFGGVEPLAYSLMEITLFFCVFLLLVKQTREGKIRVWLPIWPVLYACWAGVQIVPLPATWIAKLSPMRKFDGALAGLWPAGLSWTALSIYPHDTELAFLKFLGYLSAFLLAAHFFNSRQGKSTTVRALLLIGSFEAVYGLFQYLTGWQKIFTYTKEFFTEEATGTYINRNHFAGLLELTLPFAVAMAFYAFQKTGERHPISRGQNKGGLDPAAFEMLFYFFLTIIMLIALLFSRSRGGIISAVISLIFIVLLGFINLERKSWTLGISFMLILVMGYGLWIGLGPVLDRFELTLETNPMNQEGRISMFRDEVRLIRDHPLAGTGLGTFGIAIRPYQTTGVSREVGNAHDDYLEVASDTGVTGAGLLFLPIFYLFFKMTSSFLDDPRRFRRSITLGCIGSTLAILIHSAVDFNLQIPANALIFAAVLGMSYKIVFVERRLNESSTSRPGS
jgi:O-antigen ligase